MRIHVMHGRFQPFHLGHMSYAVEAAAGCDLLVVGLTAVVRDRDSSAAALAPHRTRPESNPLRFAERAYVVHAALAEEERVACPFVTVPFPIDGDSDRLPEIVPLEWCVVTTLHEEWNHHKVNVLRDLGYDVRIVCRDDPKRYRGEEIRRLMAAGDDAWRAMVPAAVAAALDRFGVPERLRRADVG